MARARRVRASCEMEAPNGDKRDSLSPLPSPKKVLHHGVEVAARLHSPRTSEDYSQFPAGLTLLQKARLSQESDKGDTSATTNAHLDSALGQ